MARRSNQPAPSEPSGSDGIQIDTSAGSRRKRTRHSRKTKKADHSHERGHRRRRRHRNSGAVPILLTVAAVIVGGGLLWMFVFQAEEVPELSVTFRPVAPRTLAEGEPYRYTPELRTESIEESDLVFAASGDLPDGMTLDPQTGMISWTPSEAQGPGEYEVRVTTSREDEDPLASVTMTFTVTEEVQPLVLEAPEPLALDTGQTKTVSLKVTDPDLPARPINWKLGGSSRELLVDLDAETGQATVTAVENASSGEYVFSVMAAREGLDKSSTGMKVKVNVTAPETPITRLIASLEESGTSATHADTVTLRPFSVPAEVLHLDNDENLRVFRYDSPQSLKRDIQLIGPDATTLDDEPATWAETPHFYSDREFLVLYEGERESVLSSLSDRFGKPIVVGERSMMPIEPEPEEQTLTEREEAILGMYDEGSLFRIDNYPALRTLYAAEFAKNHESALRSALASDSDGMMDWLAEHPEFREEFYLALDPEADDLSAAIQLVNELRLRNPEQLEKYGNLAIALAVTWDRPRAIYDYANHQRRTKSTLPDTLADALINWDYFIEAESVMQGRAQWLPWEFQMFLVNNKTPVEERKWAVSNYLPRRPMIGKVYSQVPYDTVMLNTGSETCRLAGKSYNLPNLVQFGGVCAMQADFAARVGKSLGVPAEYVTGENRYGDHHAWVMWVEVRNVTANSIQFSLESHGRYRGDRYYVGSLKHPKTGQRMTDRELEHYLHVVGSGPVAHRFADLLIRSLPVVDRHRDRSVDRQLKDLNTILKLSPGNSETWNEIASLSSYPDLESKHRRKFLTILNQFFATFTPFPDFTWTVFDNLVRFEDDEKKRIALYTRLTAAYEGAGRPDLASKSRLKLTELLIDADRLKEATQGLAFTILRFADEGRFVVGLLDRLETIAGTIPDSDAELVSFYLAFLQKIPTKRGNSPSEYCIRMYTRAIERFQMMNRPDLVQQLQVALNNVRAGG